MPSHRTKTKAQLTAELEAARRRIAELEAARSGFPVEAWSEGRRLSAAFGAAPDVSFILTDVQDDAEPRILDFSPGSERIFGYSRAEMIGRPVSVLHPPGDAAWHARMRRSVREDQIAFQGEVLLVRKSGEKFPLLLSVYPLLNDSGVPYAALGVGIDISGLKSAQELLLENERRYRQLFDEMITAFALHEILCDESGRPVDYRFLDVNPQFERLTGLKREQVVGRTALEVLPDIEQSWIDQYGRVALTGEPMETEQFTRALGRWFDVRAYCPSPGQFAVMFKDITERKRAEEELCESEERWRRMVDTASEGIWILDGLYRTSFVNRVMAGLLGYAPEEMLGRPVDDFLFPAERAKHQEEMARRADGLGSRYERRFRRRNGGEVWTIVSASPIMDSGGFVGAFAMIMDITERRQAEEALKAKTRELDRFFSATPDLLCITDMEGFFRRLNPEWERVLGYPLHEMLGRRFIDFVHPEDQEVTREAIEDLKGRRAARSFVARYQARDGAWRWIEWRSFPAEDRVYAVARDITERQGMEEDLLRARDEAEAASRAKSEFLAVMSHELRTPLNGVLGMLQVLEATPMSVEQLRYVHTAMGSCASLNRLLSDLLDLSRIEAGALRLAEEPFALGEGLLLPVQNLFAPVAAEKRIQFVLEADEKVAAERLMGDPTRLRQVLFNLAGNALKFTARGEVRVRAEVLSDLRPGERRLLLSVSDTGIGIPDDKLNAVIEPFIQAEAAYTRRYGGAGLGLGIVKRLLRMMSGGLCLESEVGVGTTVWCNLRLRCADAQAVVASPASVVSVSVSRPGRILVVDDEPVGRLAVELFLKRRGHRVSCAADGDQALELLARERFDCVLMDVQMPGMDGLEATRRIRSGEAGVLDPGVPVIAMTAHAMVGDREIFLAQGMDDYLAKPVDAGLLDQAVQSMLDRRGRGSGA